MAELEKQWYVLHTYSGYENKVKNNLISRVQSMGMENYIFRVIVPSKEKHEKTKEGKEKVEIINNFPGYVLVEMIMTDESWFVARNTPGVTGFVGSHGAGSKPAPLLPEEVNNILKSLGVIDNNLKFEVGESVKIIDGAFSQLTGKIIEIDSEKRKLKVSIKMFDRETSAELDFKQVDKI